MIDYPNAPGRRQMQDKALELIAARLAEEEDDE